MMGLNSLSRIFFCFLVLCATVTRLTSAHRIAGQDIDIARLFPELDEPVLSQYAVISLADKDGLDQLQTDGRFVKEVRLTSQDPHVWNSPRNWAIVKAESKIVIPAWTHAAKQIRLALKTADAQSKKYESGWLNLEGQLTDAADEDERKKIVYLYKEKAWHHMPPYLKSRLLLMTGNNLQEAKDMAKDEYVKHRRQRLLRSRERYINKRAGENTGLDMFQNSYITVAADGQGNIVVTPNTQLLERMKSSKINRPHQKQFERSWQRSAEGAYNAFLEKQAGGRKPRAPFPLKLVSSTSDETRAGLKAVSKSHAIARMNSMALRDASLRPSWLPQNPEACTDHRSHLPPEEIERLDLECQRRKRRRQRRKERRREIVAKRMQERRHWYTEEQGLPIPDNTGSTGQSNDTVDAHQESTTRLTSPGVVQHVQPPLKPAWSQEQSFLAAHAPSEASVASSEAVNPAVHETRDPDNIMRRYFGAKWERKEQTT